MKQRWTLRVLDQPSQMAVVENLQRQVWTGSETEIVPAHMLLAIVHNGGLVIGAYPLQEDSAFNEEQAALGEDEPLVGFVFGFPGISPSGSGLRLRHASHMLAVHPDYRDQGIGFALKRAQWQMLRHQGLDAITWTYDPLLSKNAYLNIARLGAVCSTYRRDFYGQLRDELNQGLPTDRFQVDWWVNTKRVERRLSSRPRLQLDLAHFLAAGAEIINPTEVGENGFSHPIAMHLDRLPVVDGEQDQAIVLLEIPSNFSTIRKENPQLAYAWRMHSREAFERLFAAGYLVTDFIYLPGSYPRSFYVLSHGNSTL